MKRLKMSAKYEPGFLARMDGRTELAKLLHTAFDEVVSDMGGAENLSHTQICLAERFVFLEHVLRTLEVQIADSNKKEETAEILSRWIQGLNAISGLAKTIGLQRRAKKIESLETYVKKAKKNGKKRKM